jgi:hypothetical protein
VIVTVHRLIAFSIPSGFLLLLLWSIFIPVRNREPGNGYWNLLAVLQVVIGIQFIVGATLFLSGHRPDSNGPQWLHYVYGAFFPGLVLAVAHNRARKTEGAPWLIFGIAAFLCAGLTFRALQTGLGID